jgi:hypothetical protein
MRAQGSNRPTIGYIVTMIFRIALVLVVAALAAPAALATQPRLSVLDTSPFLVRGSHFKPAEHVRIAVRTSDGSATRLAVTSRTGSFTMRFPTVSLGGCAAYLVRVTGSLGSVATLRVIPDCPNGPTP